MCSDYIKFCVFVLLLSSCSVLEDRDACPRILHIDLSAQENQICDSVILNVVSDGKSVWRESIARSEYSDGVDVLMNCRGEVYVNVVDKRLEYERDISLDRGLEIIRGGQCPQAYMYFSKCMLDEMETSEIVSISKNYCTVSMDFLASDLEKYRVDILGDVSGYMLDGQPSDGSFEYTPPTESSSSCTFRLPRQRDASLVMGITAISGGQTRYFAIGNYIQQSGYDWTSRNLDDICMSIDYSSTHISVNINGWEYGDEFQVEL